MGIDAEHPLSDAGRGDTLHEVARSDSGPACRLAAPVLQWAGAVPRPGRLFSVEGAREWAKRLALMWCSATRENRRLVQS
ncbi:hypothetical protein Saso_47030 [Streptomyces asoensis]|uniref:Uncharacterized protein n=1 Tax=Streptomyces asoensis TaxID=249586 RepID=A0ABQ3S4L5_9ACTN|nr:hypothetical protein Saso_47030 [Streptomyces asoensis]